jgi:hypothetical protein
MVLVEFFEDSSTRGEGMAKKTTNDALATAPNDSEQDAIDVSFDFGASGLEEIEHGDIKISSIVFNTKGVDDAGDPIPINVFLDTVSEQTTKVVRAVFCYLHKSRDFSYYDNSQDKTVRVCSSYDRVNGRIEETGVERSCDGCPHKEWRRDDRDKPAKECSDIFTVAAINLDTGLPFMIRFKKTSEKPFLAHLNKHHLNKVVRSGKYSHFPLFMFEVRISLKMDDSGKYAVPVFDRGEVLPRDEVASYAEHAKGFASAMTDLLRRAEAAELSEPISHGGYGADEGEGFVE